MRWRDLSAWWKLFALCVSLNLIEAGLVMGFDHGARPDLAPQASAIAPFGVFEDLRWISVYHNSWAAFVAEIVAMLAVRGLLTAVSVSLAWPGHLARPCGRSLVSKGILSTALATVLLAPSVALLFGIAAVPVSWLFLAAVPAALLVALLVHPVAVSGDWWRRSVSLRAIGWVAFTFVVLTVSTAVMTAAPEGLWPLIAALTGLFNAWSWVGLVHGVVDRRPARHLVPVVPVALAALVGIVIGGTVLGFVHARPRYQATSVLSPAARETGPPVLVVSGYGSTWSGKEIHPIPGNFLEEPFSYRGLDSAGDPLRYRSADTVKPLARLEKLLIAQVAVLHRRTGDRVAVVAESEGSLVAKTALLAEPSAPVSTLVMASPLVAPGRVSYPTATASGWGVATREAMQLLGGAFQSVSPVDLSPDSPFLTSVDREAPLLEKAMTCPIAGVRQFALLPLADATVTPEGGRLPFASVVVPAFHGGLLTTAPDDKIVAQVLDRRPVGENQFLQLAENVIRSAAGAWQVPALSASDYPGPAVAQRSDSTCGQVSRTLHSQVGS